MSSTGPFFPYMKTMPVLDLAVQIGRGAAAAVYGQTYSVYRLQGSTSGSIKDSTPVYVNFPMSVRRSEKIRIENQSFDLQVYVGTCDNRGLQLGDLLVETGYEALPGNQFIFAQRRPFIQESIFVRVESDVSITRAQPHSGQSAQQPESGLVTSDNYMGTDKASEWGLSLQYGRYRFVNNQLSLAGVPAGLQPLNRVRDGNMPKQIPTLLYREHFLIYTWLIPGEQFTELDRFNFPNQDRYEAASIYTSEIAGLGGYIIIAEKTGT